MLRWRNIFTMCIVLEFAKSKSNQSILYLLWLKLKVMQINNYHYQIIRKQGSGGKYCAFKPREHKDGSVSFESLCYMGRKMGELANYIGVMSL